MRIGVMVLAFVLAAGGQAAAQRPKLSLGKRIKAAVAGVVDSAATRAAAAVVDSTLGTGGSKRSAGGACPAGMVPAPGTEVTVGTELVAEVRDRIKGGADSVASPKCVPAATQPAPASTAIVAPAAVAPTGQVAPGALTPANGSTVAVAAAAAPVALMGAKAVGGLFKGKGPSLEATIKQLAKGRLELDGVRFIGRSDALKPGFEAELAVLVEALAALEGEFALNVPPEATSAGAPDTTMARRRLQKLTAHLQVAGLAPNRLSFHAGPPGLDPAAKSPKPGEARVEVIRRPAEAK